MAPTPEAFVLGLKPTVPNSAFLTTEELFRDVGGNTGNLAFQYAIYNQLAGVGTVVNWGAPPAQIDRAGRIGVLPAANQLGKHVDYATLAERFSQLRSTRLVMIGLGAQSGLDGKIPEVSSGTLRWMQEIAARSPAGAPNISVRGEFTRQVLEHYGMGDRAVVLGCPSLFINPDPALGQRIAAKGTDFRRVAVAAGHESWMHLASIEASLGRLVTATSGSYVGQHALPMMQLTRGEARLMDRDRLLACRDYVCPGMDYEDFVEWSRRHGRLFTDVHCWMEHYRLFDLVIGARIHGVMLALQAGVPGICIAHDSRTQELCEVMKVPYVLSSTIHDGVELAQLPDLFNFDADAFDRNRALLAERYLGFLRSNELQPVPWLAALAEAGRASA